MLDAADLYRILPHSDDMRLIARIVEWDENSIRCTATSHRDPANPLRVGDLLPVLCGLEYAAQALALHGVLVANESADMSLNRERIFVVIAKNVRCQVDRLDGFDDELEIRGRVVFRQSAAAVYGTEVEAAGRILLEGQLGLMSPPL